MASSSRYQGLDHPTSSLRGQDELPLSQILSAHAESHASGAGRCVASISRGPSPAGVKRKGEDEYDGRSSSGSPSSEHRQVADREPSGEPTKRARLHPTETTPNPTAASLVLAAQAEPPVSPVVLGFQMSTADPVTRDTMRNAMLMKEQQQALILQRREEQKNAEGAATKTDGVEADDTSTTGSSATPYAPKDGADAGGKKSAGLGKAGGLSIKTTGPPSSDGGMKSAPLLNQGGQGYASASRPGSSTAAPYPPSYPGSASQGPYPLARSASGSGAPVSASRTPSGSYARPMGGYSNGHVLAPLASPGYQPHSFGQAQQAPPSSARHPQAPYAPSPPSPTSAHKATFLAPFEKFYDALLDSRTLQSSQVTLEHKTQDLHRQSAALVHTLEEHHRRSASVLGTLQASSASLQEMVRKEVAVVRDEGRRELEAVLRRVEQLEGAFRDAGLKLPPTPRSAPAEDSREEAVVEGKKGGKPPARRSASNASTPKSKAGRK